MQPSDSLDSTNYTPIVSEATRMKQSFRTIIYRLREVSPGGVEMILEDNDGDGEIHPLTHPLVFHYAVWSKDRKKVQYALRFLSEHCKNLKSNGSYDSNQEDDPSSIGNVCTYQIIVKAMKMKIQFPSIQSLACKVIEDSLFITPPEKRYAAVDSGALKAVIEAMESFPDKVAVQRNACGALLFLVWDSRDVAEKLIKCNGHVLIMTALRNFPNDVTLLRNACWLLCNMSEMKGLERALLNADALQVLGSAFKSYNSHGSVLIRSSASQAMSKLLHFERQHKQSDTK